MTANGGSIPPAGSRFTSLWPVLHRGPLTTLLISLLLSCFLVRFGLEAGGYESPASTLGISLTEIQRDGEVWRFFTYAWFHHNVLLLLANIAGIWLFLPSLEYRKGIWYTSFLFFACVLFGGITVFLVAEPEGLVGATSGVVGLCMAQYFFFPTSKLIRRIPVRIGIWFYIAVLVFLHSRVDQGGDPNAGIAQVSGLLAGWIYIKLQPYLSEWIHVYRRFWNQWEEKKKTYRRQKYEELLEKIQEEGMESLTADERAFLERTRDLFDEREASEED